MADQTGERAAGRLAARARIVAAGLALVAPAATVVAAAEPARGGGAARAPLPPAPAGPRAPNAAGPQPAPAPPPTARAAAPRARIAALSAPALPTLEAAQASARFVPRGAARLDVGDGARGAALFVPRADEARRGPVVIFLHGWVALDPRRYGAWIAHLVRRGATVVYPAYQTRPAYEPARALPDLLAGVRAALAHVRLEGRPLVVAGHSTGGALAADYAAVAPAARMPAPAAVMSVYPGRRLRHLARPVPPVDLAAIAPGTPLVALAGERDRSVGTRPAREIVARAVRADTRLLVVRDDRVDDHSAPRRDDPVARRTFWGALDALIDAAAARTGLDGARRGAARARARASASAARAPVSSPGVRRADGRR